METFSAPGEASPEPLSGCTTGKPVHAAGSEVKSGSHADHGIQYLGGTLIRVPVVQVPPLAVVLGHPGICGSVSRTRVEELGAFLGRWVINNAQTSSMARTSA